MVIINNQQPKNAPFVGDHPYSKCTQPTIRNTPLVSDQHYSKYAEQNQLQPSEIAPLVSDYHYSKYLDQNQPSLH